MTSRPFFHPNAHSQESATAKSLLERYPDVTDKELATMIRAFSRYPLLDLSLLAADETLSAKLEAFHADHGRKLHPRLTRFETAVAILAVVGLFVLLSDALS